jgi:hypothetical protein
VKIIPPECSSLHQPCDVYFYGQVENYVGQLQNCPVLAAANYGLSSVGNTVQIMLEGFRIAQFLLQLIVDCLVGNTVQIMLDGFRIARFLLQPASCPDPEPARSSPYPHITLPEDQRLFILLFFPLD